MLFRSCFVVVGVIVAMPLIVFAQNDADREWVVPRTPEGAPDLQGLWTSQTYTPLQRPEIFEGREFLTDEEMASLTSILTAEDVDPLRGARAFSQALNEDAEVRESATVQADPTHYDNSMWLRTENPKTLSSRRTSLVVDPPNGRIPPLIPDAQRRAEVRRAARGTDSYQERPHQERCLMWTHEGPPMLPPPYNDLYQIFQTPDHVVIFTEQNNNPPRIIPLDGRPQISENIRQYPGDSRGHWDGDTLVIETSHFNDTSAWQGSSRGLKVIERFTRAADDLIHFEFTVEDPTTWDQSWSAEIPMMSTDGPMYEYACHEGNHDIRHILEVYRNIEKQEAEGTR